MWCSCSDLLGSWITSYAKVIGMTRIPEVPSLNSGQRRGGDNRFHPEPLRQFSESTKYHSFLCKRCCSYSHSFTYNVTHHSSAGHVKNRLQSWVSRHTTGGLQMARIMNYISPFFFRVTSYIMKPVSASRSTAESHCVVISKWHVVINAPASHLVDHHSSVALPSLFGPWPPHPGCFLIYVTYLKGFLWTSD